jgi:hypothetical protein
MTTSNIPLALRTSQAGLPVCFGSIKVEGSEINALIEASNTFGFCVACLDRVLYIRVNRVIFRPEKLEKIGYNSVFRNVSQVLSLNKMTRFGPRGLTQWRTHWPSLFWLE